jgi:ribosomal protein S18 acetylase RimI-like enzyme
MDPVPNNASIRAATAADTPAVTECVHAAYQHYIARIGRPPGPMLDDYAQVIAGREVYVAESGGEVVGVLVLGPADEGFLLDNIAVSPAAQGKGLGRRLLDLAEARAKAAGYTSIYLYTHVKMIENQAIYGKRGYVEYDRRTEGGLTRVFMRKKL